MHGRVQCVHWAKSKKVICLRWRLASAFSGVIRKSLRLGPSKRVIGCVHKLLLCRRMHAHLFGYTFSFHTLHCQLQWQRCQTGCGSRDLVPRLSRSEPISESQIAMCSKTEQEWHSGKTAPKIEDVMLAVCLSLRVTLPLSDQTRCTHVYHDYASDTALSGFCFVRANAFMP